MQQLAAQYWQLLMQIPAFEPGLLFLLVFLLAQYAALPQQYQIWPLLRLLAQRIELKVNKSTDSRSQQRLAGALALTVVLLPVLLLSWTLRQLSEWPVGFDAILLYLCLDFRNYQLQVQSAASSLHRQQYQLAKDQLQPLLRRECGQLSATGLAKAGIEVLAQRQVRHVVAVLLWYLLGGAMLALSYRLLLELQQAWSGKMPSQRAFSGAVSACGRLFTLPALWLHGALVGVLYRFRPTLRYFNTSQNAGLPAADRWYLSAWSAALQRNLAGPVIYQGTKLRRERIGASDNPQLADLQLMLQLTRQIQRTLFLLLSCGFALTILYQWPQPF
ncbi:MAG: cobalamin biosynthesis protein [Rheinheimera sp.]|nr:cobalamin biosynthesis protein [Rheinheimera sp.]